jgi:hypothetical protein
MQNNSCFAAGFLIFRERGIRCMLGIRNKAKGIDFKAIESAILIYILIPGLIKRLEEVHEKMQPYTFSLAP